MNVNGTDGLPLTIKRLLYFRQNVSNIDTNLRQIESKVNI